jgi:D-alanine-D-alanine ligase
VSAPAAATPPVAVVFGGPSAEHDVSVVSGTAIAEALAGAGHAVSQFLVDLDAGWWLLPAGHRRDGRPAAAYDDPGSLGTAGPFAAGEATAGIAAAVPQPVVFVALHGPFGEDGTIQAILEAAGLAYTGAGIAASAVGMDKPFFKRIARDAGLPILPWVEVTAARWAADPAGVRADLAALAAGAPDGRLIAKPASLGSSVGMAIAHGPDERDGIVELALRYDARAIVEPGLDRPRELELGILGNDPATLRVFGPGEVIPDREFYDYAAKYLASGSRTLAAADISTALAADVRRVGSAAYALIGGAGFARVDFLLERSTGALYLNEINTIPGFTPISLFPMMAATGGLPFAELCGRIVGLAIERRAAAPARRLSPTDLPR